MLPLLLDDQLEERDALWFTVGYPVVSIVGILPNSVAVVVPNGRRVSAKRIVYDADAWPDGTIAISRDERDLGKRVSAAVRVMEKQSFRRKSLIRQTGEEVAP